MQPGEIAPTPDLRRCQMILFFSYLAHSLAVATVKLNVPELMGLRPCSLTIRAVPTIS